MSLVLTRKENEAVYIDRHIKVKVIEARNGNVKLKTGVRRGFLQSK